MSDMNYGCSYAGENTHYSSEGARLCTAKYQEELSGEDWTDADVHYVIHSAEEEAAQFGARAALESSGPLKNLMQAVEERTDDDELQHLLWKARGEPVTA